MKQVNKCKGCGHPIQNYEDYCYHCQKHVDNQLGNREAVTAIFIAFLFIVLLVAATKCAIL